MPPQLLQSWGHKKWVGRSGFFVVFFSTQTTEMHILVVIMLHQHKFCVYNGKRKLKLPIMCENSVLLALYQFLFCFVNIWARTWQNQQNECAPSENSDQPGHSPSLIRVIAVRSMGSYGPKLSWYWQGRLGSDWVHAQADLSLRWVHSHIVGFDMSRLIFLENVVQGLWLQET